jgi:uracil phosphoribosyltransferase
MIQRGLETSFTNLWSLLLYLQSLLHYIETAQENKKNTNVSYNIAENSKRVKRNEEKVCVCVCLDAGWCLVSTFI